MSRSRLKSEASLPVPAATLLFVGVEGPPRRWRLKRDKAPTLMKRLGLQVSQIITKHEGVQLLLLGHENAFAVTFVDTDCAVACALQLQQASLKPFRLRIGIHRGLLTRLDEVPQIVDTAARLCDLAQSGQIIMTKAVVDRVLGRLPDGAWLTGVGHHSPNYESSHLVQLCHRSLGNSLPPLRESYAPYKHSFLSIAT